MELWNKKNILKDLNLGFGIRFMAKGWVGNELCHIQERTVLIRTGYLSLYYCMFADSEIAPQEILARMVSLWSLKLITLHG